MMRLPSVGFGERGRCLTAAPSTPLSMPGVAWARWRLYWLAMSATALPDDKPVLTLVGETVALGPQRRELALLIQRWLNDFRVVTPLGMPFRGVTREDSERLFEESSRDERQRWFMVYERTTERPIGVTGLRDIDHVQRTAEFVIFLGERECWGKGYGAETARLMLDYGFHALGLHSILLRVYDFNVRGQRAYTRAGFREVGRWRQAHRLGDQPADIIFMDCIASEFDSPVLRRLLADINGAPEV